MPTTSICTSFIGTDTEVTVRYIFTPGKPAKLYGPPENCHLGSPDTVEITSVLLGPYEIVEYLSDDDAQILWERVFNNFAADYQDHLDERNERD
jgi:hypothetical protein